MSHDSETKHNGRDLSRRERQIMDLLYRGSRLTAAEVLDGLPDAPSYSATRALLRILEQKGHVRHEEDGPRYVFIPCVPRQEASVMALRHVLNTFFDGSAVAAAAALVDGSASKLSVEELDRLKVGIERARRR